MEYTPKLKPLLGQVYCTSEISMSSSAVASENKPGRK